jgi:DNA-binding transcriptional ArsR family regulator
MTAGSEAALDRVYAAIADPTRRAILATLADAESNIGALAERFPMSFGGVSKHVRVLEQAGLVARTVHGREHRVRLNAAPLRQAAAWLEHYRDFWSRRLDALQELFPAPALSEPTKPQPKRAVRPRARRARRSRLA